MHNVLYIKWGSKRPIFGLLINFSNNTKKLYKLWSDGNKVFDILQKENELFDNIQDLDCIAVVGYKKFIDYFGKKLTRPVVYDLYYDSEESIITKLQNDYDNKLLFVDWQKIRAESCEAYFDIEKRGLMFDYKKVNPKYSNDVFSGRSKTVGFNIQGTNESYDIRHIDARLSLFLSFDWISADARMGAFISNDKNLMDCFKNSDPYSFIADALDNKISRDLCKSEWNKAVNSLDCSNPIFKLFPEFEKWLVSQINKLSKNGYVESILGRRFYSDGSHKQNKRAINSIFQGSVAHAMQNVIYNVNKELNGILTEQHDSITVCTNESLMSKHVKKISNIIYEPLRGYNSITMPLRIGLGKSWGNYKYFKECR